MYRSQLNLPTSGAFHQVTISLPVVDDAVNPLDSLRIPRSTDAVIPLDQLESKIGNLVSVECFIEKDFNIAATEITTPTRGGFQGLILNKIGIAPEGLSCLACINLIAILRLHQDCGVRQ